MIRSPFPGMDPWLEASWGDVHTQLIARISAQLQPLLPGDLRARVQEHVTVDAGALHAGRYPDVRVVERPGIAPDRDEAVQETVTAQPLVLELSEFLDEPMTERFIEIRETRTGHRLVTVIEVLSPANKLPSPNRDVNLQKQAELRWADVNLVEIDLLRSGAHLLPVPDDRIPESHRSPYRVTIQRARAPRQVYSISLPLRERLPVIGIPLRETDKDVSLDLQQVVEYCYDAGGYDDIDYREAPTPLLDADDAAWADAILRGRGLRG